MEESPKMLQTIREHTQGWIAGVIISIIILSFALWGIHSYFTGGTNDSVVARVNGVDISKEQLAVAYERLRRQVQQYGANSPLAKDERALKHNALQGLIEMQVLKQASLDQDFRISDMQVDAYLQSLPEFQVNGQFSLERFQQLLSSTLLSTSEFLDLIRTSLLIDQPKLGIVLTSFALPAETNATISLVNQERNINYLIIPTQSFLSKPMTISHDRIQAYYDANKNDFMTPEQVNVEYVELSLKDLAATMTPPEAELKNFYSENINTYTMPTQWKLIDIEVPLATDATPEQTAQAKAKMDAIIDTINKGGDFEKAVTGNQQSLSGKEWMALNQIPEELQKAVATLTKPGQISDPIKTSKALVVIKAVEIKEPKIQTYEAAKDKVKETFVRQHAEEKFAELRDQLADLTYEHPESLQPAAKALNLPIKTSELFTRDKSGTDISQYKKVRDIAFSNDVLTLQNNSDVIQLNPETVIVLRTKSHTPSTLLPLKDITTQIEDKLKMQDATAQAKKLASELTAKLYAGDAPSQVTAGQGQWTDVGDVGRYSTKVDSAILDLAFRLANPAMNANKPVYGITRVPTGYAIVSLNQVKEGQPTDSHQASVFAEQVQTSEGLLEYELYKQSQISKAKIKIY